MKTLSRFSLNLRIFVIPVVLLINGYILVLGENSWMMSHNAENFSKKEFALLIDSERKPLEMGMKLIAATKNTGSIFLAPEKGASGLMEDLLKQTKLLGITNVLMLDKKGTLLYPKDYSMSADISSLIAKSAGTIHFTETKTVGSDLVTYGTVFDADSLVGFLVFLHPLPPEMVSIATTVTNHADNTASINTDADLKNNMEKINSAWSKFKKDSLFWSLAMSAWCVFFLIVTFYINTKSLLNTFRNVSRSLTDSSGEVLSASTTIASSAQQLSTASTQQASSLEQTAAAIEELTGMVMKNSENSRMASNGSDESRATAGSGKAVVENMISVIEEISTSNNEIIEQINQGNQQLEGIVRVISEIGNKTKIINDIVFQTKLLSFNASVEAARAGEHGKGFSVVAEEIGNLSLMSGNAAKEISEILDESINKVESIIRETREKVGQMVETGKAKVDQGTETAHQCGDVLNKIYESVTRVAGMSLEISEASDEQSKAVQEIANAMHQLEKSTHQNSLTATESANASEGLSLQAQNMNGLVTVLLDVVEGAK